MEFPFYQVDVFTDRAFGGNPLAVFTKPEGLTDAQHLQIAREMNLSETTFIYPTDNSSADFKIRIFTPGKEIPFAGHPTLGTAHILWETGSVKPDQATLILEMGIGPIKVTRQEDFLFMEQPAPEFGPIYEDKAQVASALSLRPQDIDSRYPIQTVSTGFPALYVPLAGLEVLNRIQLNFQVLRDVLGPLDMIYVFTGETESPASTVHVRAFAPFVGIPEDPATGSAGGAMGAYLVHHRFSEEMDPKNIIIEQGFEMQRPSHIHVSAREENGVIEGVRVGGQCRTVIQGVLRV